MVNLEQLALLTLAKISLEHELQGKSFDQYPTLVDGINEQIITGRDMSQLISLAENENFPLAQYLRRVLRAVASEEVVASVDEDYRLVLFGIGFLIPSTHPLTASDVLESCQELQDSLFSQWSEYAVSLRMMCRFLSLDKVYSLSALDTRAALLDIFATGTNSNMARCSDVSQCNYIHSLIVPAVIALHKDTADEFIAKCLKPGAPSRDLMSIKNRIEALLEGSGADFPRPMMLPPCSWANLFPFVRIMHFRYEAEALIKAYPEHAHSWSITYTDRKLSLNNFKARVSRELLFPEASLSDIKKIVLPLASRLGVTFNND